MWQDDRFAPIRLNFKYWRGGVNEFTFEESQKARGACFVKLLPSYRRQQTNLTWVCNELYMWERKWRWAKPVSVMGCYVPAVGLSDRWHARDYFSRISVSAPPPPPFHGPYYPPPTERRTLEKDSSTRFQFLSSRGQPATCIMYENRILQQIYACVSGAVQFLPSGFCVAPAAASSVNRINYSRSEECAYLKCRELFFCLPFHGAINQNLMILLMSFVKGLRRYIRFPFPSGFVPIVLCVNSRNWRSSS